MKPEAQLVLQIKQYLNYKGIYFHRINTGLIRNEKDKFYRSAEKGTPDFLLCVDGKFVAVEAKSPKGKQSFWQMQDEERLKKSGGQYWIIRDLDSLEQALKKLERK